MITRLIFATEPWSQDIIVLEVIKAIPKSKV